MTKESPVDEDLDRRIWAVLESSNPPTTPWGIRNLLWAAGLTVVDRPKTAERAT